MGDPRKPRKQYQTAAHPWIREKIVSEKILMKEYGLKTKQEILKSQSFLKKVRDQAKRLIRDRLQEQAKKEHKQLILKLTKLGLCNENSSLEDLLALNVKNVLDKRLQTLVAKQGLAMTANQARQLIIHGHIAVNGKKMTVPSYLVLTTDVISYKPNSTFASEDHPERMKLVTKSKGPVEVVEEGKEEKKMDRRPIKRMGGGRK